MAVATAWTILCQRKCVCQRHAGVGRDVIKPGCSRTCVHLSIYRKRGKRDGKGRFTVGSTLGSIEDDSKDQYNGELQQDDGAAANYRKLMKWNTTCPVKKNDTQSFNPDLKSSRNNGNVTKYCSDNKNTNSLFVFSGLTEKRVKLYRWSKSNISQLNATL